MGGEERGGEEEAAVESWDDGRLQAWHVLAGQQACRRPGTEQARQNAGAAGRAGKKQEAATCLQREARRLQVALQLEHGRVLAGQPLLQVAHAAHGGRLGRLQLRHQPGGRGGAGARGKEAGEKTRRLSGNRAGPPISDLGGSGPSIVRWFWLAGCAAPNAARAQAQGRRRHPLARSLVEGLCVLLLHLGLQLGGRAGQRGRLRHRGCGHGRLGRVVVGRLGGRHCRVGGRGRRAARVEGLQGSDGRREGGG